MAATVDLALPFEQLDTTKVSGGAATVYLAPVGTAMVSDTAVSMGTAWGGAWVPLGSTDDGWHLGITPNTVDWNIEESPIPANIQVDTLDVAVSASLKEDQVANFRYAVGVGTIASQVAGIGAVAKSTLTLNTILNQFALGIEHANAYAHWTRYFIPIVVGAGTLTVDMRRAQSPRMYGANFRAICLPSQIQVIQKTGESTG